MAAAAAAIAAAPASAEEVDWRAAALGDVRAAYDLYVANHPGMHDPANPGFPAQLARARDEALAHAERAAGEADYRDALGAFSTVLQDGHARLVPSQAGGATGRFEWPGFVAAWRGDALLVHHAAPGAPVERGERILACDGRPVEEVIRGRLLASGFRPSEQGHWWRLAPHAFLPAAGARDLPSACTFEDAAGAEREAALVWSEAPEEAGMLANAATDGDRTPIGLSEPRPGLFLIGMPTFGPDADGVAAYRRLFEELKERRAGLAAARAVIVDLRHNNGGSSRWSMEAARALWGAGTVDAAVDNHLRGVRIWWRASEGNTSYLASLEDQLRRDGNEEFALLVRDVAAGMATARAAGEPFFVEPKEETEPAPVPPSDFAAPVYVITPGRCASACLDALDVFTRFANTRLIGAPTSADSTYMEVRVEDLPSGRGRIVIPNKIWVGRPRGSGEFYRPHVPVDDLDWSTATFLDAIERDLARR